jgi:hypothetical protein
MTQQIADTHLPGDIGVRSTPGTLNSPRALDDGVQVILGRQRNNQDR